jgi:hypothetical protein
MTQYRGFTYEAGRNGGWTLWFPDGTRLRTPAQTEEQLRAEIDQFIEPDVPS